MSPTATWTVPGPGLPPEPAVVTTGGDRLLLTEVRLAPIGPADPLGADLRESWAVHVGRLGVRPVGTPALLDVAAASGLTGYGGAHMPAAAKWRATAARSGPLTVVANGAESEPVAGKDGTLMRQRPHLVLDGLELLAESLGASRAVVWLHGDDEGARSALRNALLERPRVPGAVRPEIVAGPVHYLAGESSAIARALAGHPALPVVRRPPTDPAAPRTLVHNVETLARLALVARGRAPAATRLLTVLGDRRAVVEVDDSVLFAELLSRLGWTVAPQAVLLGGYGGLWASWDRVGDQPLHEGSLRAQGLALGAGVVIPLAAGRCGLRETAAIVRYLASMSARQCGPCAFGLPALADSCEALADGRPGHGRLASVLADAALVEGRGACHHPDGATRLVASAIATFDADATAHAAGRPCRASQHVGLPGLAP